MSNVTGPSLTSSTSMWAPKRAATGPRALAEALVERLGPLGPGRVHERRPVALAGVAVERELRHAEELALAERLVHPAVRVLEDPQRADLLGEPVGVLGPVVVGDPEQHQQPGPDLGDALPADGHRGAETRWTSALTAPAPAPTSRPRRCPSSTPARRPRSAGRGRGVRDRQAVEPGRRRGGQQVGGRRQGP